MIHNIDFTAKLPQKSVRQRLLKSINTCKSIRGAVAYWTIGTDFFQEKLTHALSLPDSFICVDLKLPTQIDQLASFVQKKSNIYLHHYMLVSSIKHETKDNLLHEKVLLFEYENEAEIWVGSHNMTIRALTGINKEAALIIRLSKDDNLYTEVDNHLTYLRNICIPFDLDHVEYYKWLQGKFDSPELILKMFTPNLDILRNSKPTIQLLGKDKFMFSQLKTVNKYLYLEITNFIETTFFSAEVQLVGDINPLSPESYDIDFQPMMHASIQKNEIPIIQPESSYNITSDRIKNYKYLINIRVDKEISSLSYVKEPKDLWDYENVELDSNNEDEDENLFMIINIPDFVNVKKASVEKMTNQVSYSIENTSETINKEAAGKLLAYYDEIVSKNMIENNETDKPLPIPTPIPEELKRKSSDIIFKALINKP